MKEAYKVLVRRYHYKGRDFIIAKELHDGIIRAIDLKYINENGRLTRPLNGLEMFCDSRFNTVPEIIRRINDHIDFMEYAEKYHIDKNDAELFAKAAVDFFKRRGA